ncbi:MAG TPA: SRPBCC family protein [Segeticoccus sp.]|uniref:SRPBCC family protein n=1 Tax=Segeticoccus sp. TaxID=2706531 RepID=UPI002D7FE065|nr:SRPBCC family protein [Segeticoccus sp.]HET8599884.1 SRPBCC family protein [Segeticoccus sp.]
MAAFDLRRVVPAPVPVVWQVVTDFGGYGRFIPLTTVRTDPGPPGQGWCFTGLTGLGQLRLPDTMRLTRWRPPVHAAAPAAFTVVKTGPLLAGWADVQVSPHPQGSLVRWQEEIVPRPVALGRLTAPLLDRGNAALFRHALARMAAEASPGGR